MQSDMYQERSLKYRMHVFFQPDGHREDKADQVNSVKTILLILQNYDCVYLFVLVVVISDYLFLNNKI